MISFPINIWELHSNNKPGFKGIYQEISVLFAVEDPWLVEGLEILAKAVNLRARLYPREYILVCLLEGVVRLFVGWEAANTKED